MWGPMDTKAIAYERIQAPIKFYDRQKGFGFFKRPNKPDIFFTESQLSKSSIPIQSVKEDKIFEFDLVPIPGKGGKAVNIKKV